MRLVQVLRVLRRTVPARAVRCARGDRSQSADRRRRRRWPEEILGGRSFEKWRSFHTSSCLMNGGTNRLIGSATANVAAHGFIDLVIGWSLRFCEKRGG